MAVASQRASRFLSSQSNSEVIFTVGIGKVKVIKATSPDSLFIEIKKDQFTEVLIGAKKMKLITSHPEGSYELINNGLKVEKIIVLDPKAFWKNGNYLVIQADK